MNINIELKEQIISICRKYDYIEKVILFGSRARGDNEEKSDIDLAVYSDRSIMEFIEDIELNTRTLLEFDFSNMNTKNDEFFKEQVHNDGIVLYERHI